MCLLDACICIQNAHIYSMRVLYASSMRVLYTHIALVNRKPGPPTPGDIPGFNGTLRGKYRLLTNVACLLPGVLTLT